MPQKQLSKNIEALIFVSSQSITLTEIIGALQIVFEQEFQETEILSHIYQIEAQYKKADLAIELVKINDGYQFLTRKEYYHTINQLQLNRSKKKLSQAAMETLAIIAYKQPITKLEIEQIRGVNSDYSVQRLLEKELVSIEGKSNGPGRPILYKTSNLFMDYFGLENLSQMPQLKDLAKVENTIGDVNE